MTDKPMTATEIRLREAEWSEKQRPIAAAYNASADNLFYLLYRNVIVRLSWVQYHPQLLLTYTP